MKAIRSRIEEEKKRDLTSVWECRKHSSFHSHSKLKKCFFQTVYGTWHSPNSATLFPPFSFMTWTKICVPLFRSLSIPSCYAIFSGTFLKRPHLRQKEKKDNWKRKGRKAYPVEKIYSHNVFYIQWNNWQKIL